MVVPTPRSFGRDGASVTFAFLSEGRRTPRVSTPGPNRAGMPRASRGGFRPRRGRAQLPDDVEEEVQIGRGGAPVADRRAQRHPPAVDGGTGEDPAVVEQCLAEPAVDVVELGLGEPGRPVAEAD